MGAFDAELRAGIVWDQTGTDAFLQHFEEILNRISAQAAGGTKSAFGAGEMLRTFEAAIQKIQAELDGLSVSKGFDVGGLFGIEEKLARVRASVSPDDETRRWAGVTGVPASQRLSKGYDAADDRLQQQARAQSVIERNAEAEAARIATSARRQAQLQSEVDRSAILREQRFGDNGPSNVIGTTQILAEGDTNQRANSARFGRGPAALRVATNAAAAEEAIIEEEKAARQAEARATNAKIAAAQRVAEASEAAADQIKAEQKAEQAARASARNAQIAAALRVATASENAAGQIEAEQNEAKAAKASATNAQIAAALRVATASEEAALQIKAEQKEAQAAKANSTNAQIAAALRVATASEEAALAIEAENEAAKAAKASVTNAQIAAALRVATASEEAALQIKEEEQAARAAKANSTNAQIAAALRVATASEEAALDIEAEAKRARQAKADATNAQIAAALRVAAASEEAAVSIEEETRERRQAKANATNAKIAAAQRVAEVAYDAEAAIELENVTVKQEAAAIISRQVEAQQLDFEVASLSLDADSGALEWKVKAAVAQEQLAIAYEAQLKTARAAAGLPAKGGGGFLGALSPNGDAGEFFGKRILSQASFFASGLIVFGLVNQIREAVKAAGELEKEFGVIQTILDQFGSGTSLDTIKNQVLSLSVETATSASEVAKVERQLAGVFANRDTGAPDFQRGGVETETALKFAKVTGESFTEIVDDFSAISVSFKQKGTDVATTFRDIANSALNLGQQLGVPEADILKFTSDLAPLGASLGFTATQLAGLGAVAEQASGRGASGLAEQIGRSLAGLQDKFPQLIELFGSNNATKGIVKDLGEAFGSGDIPKVLEDLVANYDKLNKAQIQNLALIVGGRREAGTFYALLQRAPQTLKALREGFEKPQGDLLDERFSKVADTITFKFDQAKLAVQRFLLEILDSGAGKGLNDLADLITTLATGVSTLVSLLSDLNQAFFDGFLGKLAGPIAEIYLLTKGLEKLAGVMVKLQEITALAKGTQLGSILLGKGAAAPAEAAAGEGAVSAEAVAPVAGGAALAGGVLPFVAVAAAALAVNRLQVALDQHSDIVNDGKKIEAQALDELKHGVTIAQIRNANQQGDQGIQGYARDAYLTLTNTRDTPAAIDDANQKFENSQKVAEYSALAQATGDQRPYADAKVLKDNPTSDLLNAAADQKLKSVTDPKLRKILDDAAAKAKIGLDDLTKTSDAIDAAAARIADPTAAVSLDDLQHAFEKGDAGPTAVDQLLKSRLADLTIAIDAAKEGGKPADDPDIQKLRTERDKLEKQLGDNIKKSVLGDVQYAQKLREALGQKGLASDVEQTLHEVISSADTLNASGSLDASTEQDLIFQGLDALKETRKQQAEKALNSLDKDRILASDIPIPPSLQRLLVDVQFRSGSGADQVNTFATKMNITTDAARAQLVDMVFQFAGQVGGFENAVISTTFKYGKDALAAAEKLGSHLKSGFGAKVDRSVLDKAILTITGITPAEIDTFAANMDTSTHVAQERIVALFNVMGGDITKIRSAMLSAELRVAQTALIQSLQFYAKWKDFELLASAAKAKVEQALNENAAILAAVGVTAAVGTATSGLGQGVGDTTPTIPGTIGPEPGSQDAAAKDARAEAQAEANAQLDIEAAQSKGDVVALAHIAQRRAQLDLEYATNQAERLAALAKMAEADRGLVDALLEHNANLRDLALAQSGDDPIVAAQNALANAYDALANASGVDDIIKAQAAVERAQRGVADAMQAAVDAQFDLLIAIDNAGGNTVKAAQDSLAKLYTKLANADALQLTGSERDQLVAQIVAAGANVTQQIISEGESSIQTDLTLKRITMGQAVAELEALRAKAISSGATQKEIDQISIEIQNLKGTLGQDLKFNLPSILGLPNLYEAKRVDQTGGGSAYTDNRVVTVNINAQTNATASQIGQAVSDAIGPTRSIGPRTRRY